MDKVSDRNIKTNEKTPTKHNSTGILNHPSQKNAQDSIGDERDLLVPGELGPPVQEYIVLGHHHQSTKTKTVDDNVSTSSTKFKKTQKIKNQTRNQSIPFWILT